MWNPATTCLYICNAGITIWVKLLTLTWNVNQEILVCAIVLFFLVNNKQSGNSRWVNILCITFGSLNCSDGWTDWRTVIKIVLGFIHLKLQMSNVDIIFVHKSISFHLSNSGLWLEPVPAVTGQQARYTIDISFKRISCVMHWERLTDAMWDIPKESALKLSVLLSRLHGIVFMTCRSITCVSF